MEDSLPDAENDIVTDDSCPESICVEYDSRSSSHDDIDEYLQCKDTNLIKATQRQRQLLKDRNARLPVIQVPDTYFDQIASILNRSLYLCKMEKKEEKSSSGSASSDESLSGNKSKSHSSYNSSGNAEKDTELRMPLSQAGSQPSLLWPYEGNASTEDFLGETNEETHQENYVKELQESTEKDMLNNDTLDEIFSFVNKCNEGKNKCVKECAKGSETSVDGSNCINFRSRNDLKLNNKDNIYVSKRSVTKLKERPFGGAQIGKKSSNYQAANTNCRRKSDSLQSLGKKKQELKFRSKNEPKYLRAGEHAFLWEAKKVTARSKCHIVCSNEVLRNKKPNQAEYSVATSDSEHTIRLEKIDGKVMNTDEKGSGSHRTSLTLKGVVGRMEMRLATDARERANHILQRSYQANAEAQYTSAASSKQKKRTNGVADGIRWEQEAAANKPLGFDTRKSGVKLSETMSDVPIKKRKSKRERLATNGSCESVIFKIQALAKAKNDEKCKGKAIGYPKSNKSCNDVEKDVQNRVPPSIKWSIEPRLQTKRSILKKNRKAKDKEDDDVSEGGGQEGSLPAGDLSRKGPTLPRRAFPNGMNAAKPPLPPAGKKPFR